MEQYIKIVLIISIVIIISIILYELINFEVSDGNKTIPDANWPFINLLNEKGDKINVMCIRGPVVKDLDIKIYRKHKESGIRFIGCSSYLSFPLQCRNPTQMTKGGVCYSRPMLEGKLIEEMVDGWLHCFRDPSKIMNKNKLLVSESDFMDSIQYLRNFDIRGKQDKYDFICYCPLDPNGCENGWHFYNKNWPLCRETIEVLCNDFNMKGILIGRDNCPINIKNKDNLIMKSWLHYHTFLKCIADSKFMIVSSTEDASPRTMGESLLLGTPILVNKGILGGWKYVNERTGLFYDKNDCKEKIREMMENIKLGNFRPREYYVNNYGLYNAGKRLRDFLVQLYPELSNNKYIRFAVS
tara:strand:+ start:202 stop:1266 length:1065 start_codon:yes stop_codon:yes gene_type:complete